MHRQEGKAKLAGSIFYFFPKLSDCTYIAIRCLKNIEMVLKFPKNRTLKLVTIYHAARERTIENFYMVHNYIPSSISGLKNWFKSECLTPVSVCTSLRASSTFQHHFHIFDYIFADFSENCDAV